MSEHENPSQDQPAAPEQLAGVGEADDGGIFSPGAAALSPTASDAGRVIDGPVEMAAPRGGVAQRLIHQLKKIYIETATDQAHAEQRAVEERLRYMDFVSTGPYSDAPPLAGHRAWSMPEPPPESGPPATFQKAMRKMAHALTYRHTVKGGARATSPVMTPYEYAALITARAKDIAQSRGVIPKENMSIEQRRAFDEFLKVRDDAISIARFEIDNYLDVNLSVQRPISIDMYETIKSHELILPHDLYCIDSTDIAATHNFGTFYNAEECGGVAMNVFSSVDQYPMSHAAV